MKTTTIDTAAAWAGTIATIQDGDPASEANMDLVSDSIGDRLGYLKTKADGAAYLAAATQTFTGAAVWSGAATVTIDPDGANDIVADDVRFNSTATSSLVLQAASNGGLYGAIWIDVITLTDANQSLSELADLEYRVPQLTANREYTLPGGGVTTLGVIDASAAGWIEFRHSSGVGKLLFTRPRSADAFTVTFKGSSSWKVSRWGGTVSSLSATV